MGKKIKKAVKKVFKEIARPVKNLAGGGDVHIEAPAPQAALVDVPVEKDVTTEDEAQTESGRKKARAGGKKSLSVARSAGGGINI